MLRLLFTILFLLGATEVQAGAFDCRSVVDAPTQGGLLAAVEKRYREISNIRADFIQQSVFVGLDRREFSKGYVFFRKPGMMDWIYEQPEEQRFLSDGRTIWYYQPSFHQVTITDFNNSFSSELPVTFLLGVGSLSESFTLRSACRTDEGVLAELEPKRPDSSLSSFFLLLSNYAPIGARVRDAGGNETTITFLNSRYNSNPNAHQFVMEIPKGADVIDQRSAAGAPKAVSETSLVEGDEQRSLKERFQKQSTKSRK